MKRSVLKALCIASGVLFGVLGISLIITYVQAAQSTHSVGIIGGADGPTAIFLLQRFLRTPLIVGIITAFLVFCGTGLTLLFSGKAKS